MDVGWSGPPGSQRGTETRESGTRYDDGSQSGTEDSSRTSPDNRRTETVRWVPKTGGPWREKPESRWRREFRVRTISIGTTRIEKTEDFRPVPSGSLKGTFLRTFEIKFSRGRKILVFLPETNKGQRIFSSKVWTVVVPSHISGDSVRRTTFCVSQRKWEIKSPRVCTCTCSYSGRLKSRGRTLSD